MKIIVAVTGKMRSDFMQTTLLKGMPSTFTSHADSYKMCKIFNKKKKWRIFQNLKSLDVEDIPKKVRGANLIFVCILSNRQLKVFDRSKILDSVIEFTDPKAKIFYYEMKDKTNWLSVWAGW